MRLTADEIKENKQRLAGWFSPTEMREHAERLMDRLGCEDLFKQPGLEFIREAWVAAEFGERRGASAVRLIAEARPDLALRFDCGDVERYEIYELIEAVSPDRKRGDEYVGLAAAGCPIYLRPIDEWGTAEQALISIRANAEMKSKKAEELTARGTPYPEQTRLLFYVNLQDFRDHAEGIEDELARAVEPSRKWFSSVWALWNNRIYQV